MMEIPITKESNIYDYKISFSGDSRRIARDGPRFPNVETPRPASKTETKTHVLFSKQQIQQIP